MKAAPWLGSARWKDFARTAKKRSGKSGDCKEASHAEQGDRDQREKSAQLIAAAFGATDGEVFFRVTAAAFRVAADSAIRG